MHKIYNIINQTDVQLLVSDDIDKIENIKIPDEYSLVEFEDLADKADIILAIGGDGTILSTVRRMKQIQKPILGIHIGGLGFLSECAENEIKKSIDYIIAGDYNISNRMILEVIVDLNGF